MGLPNLRSQIPVDIDFLQRLPFFQNFHRAWLETLVNVASLDFFQPGQYLLLQEKENSKLFFLLNGQVEIIVDDQPVAVLDKIGDLFGEMSVISSQKVTASVRAVTAVEVLCLEAQEWSEKSDWSVHEIQHLLFRMYSQILTEKLKSTNQKAKFFERTNQALQKTQAELESLNQALEQKVAQRTADLEKKQQALMKANSKLETQNSELLLSHKKFEQLYADRDMTLQKLEDLYRTHLLPLQFSFDFLQHRTNPETAEALNQAKRQVLEIVRLLEPMESMISLQKAAHNRRVLCVESSKKQQLVARLAMGGSGVLLDIVSETSEALPLIEKQVYDIVFFQPESAEAAFRVLDINPQAQLVLMTSQHVSELFENLKKLPTVPNVVSRSEDDRVFSIKNISTTVTKLSANDIFGLEKYLSWGADVQSRKIQSSKDRAGLSREVDEYFASLGIRKTVRDRALTVLEELMMNAIYDAPTDAQGNSLYNHLPRTVPVMLSANQESKLSFACDGMLLAMSVSDPFGSLTGETILNYLESCYTGSAGKLNKNKGGAGRGLHQIIENSDLVVFNIQPKVQSEVIALLNIDLKEARVLFPSFHLFVTK